MISRKRIRYLAAYPAEATEADVTGLIGLLSMQRDAMTVMAGVGEPMVVRVGGQDSEYADGDMRLQAAVALPARDDDFFEVLDVGDGEEDNSRPRLRAQTSRIRCEGGHETVIAFRLFDPMEAT